MLDESRDLATVMPFEEIKRYFSREVSREELRKADLTEINRRCRSDMFGLAVHCGIRAKQVYKPDLDMVPLFPLINQGDPALLAGLSAVLKEEALDDIYCCRCTVDGQLVASLMIAQVWPRDLYIGMVTFADPSKPIPPDQQKSVLQKFKGLGLLPTLLDRTERCAATRGCKNITLTANETSQSALFKRFGFVVDDYPGVKERVAAGQSIPMHKPIP